MNHKVLLIAVNAKFIHSNPAIYSLKAYADRYYSDRPDGCTIDIAEYTINQTPSAILADIYQKKPQMAAFSCYIWNWNIVQDLLTELPKLLPDTALWLGGPEVSFHAQRRMQELPMLTGIMVGEGEETFLELLKHYWEHQIPLQKICGIVCKDEFTGVRKLTDINRIPFFYQAKSYQAKISSAKPEGKSDTSVINLTQNDTIVTFKNRIIYYESQRGCPFQCTYCLSSIDRQVRLRDIETVKSELQYFLDCRVPQVKFIDRTFNCNAEHAFSIWKYLSEHDNGVTNFHFEIAADLLTLSQLTVLCNMRPGLIQLEIGVQSTNETTLRAINRHMDINALKNNVATIRSFQNIHQHLDLIAGLPYEDYDSFAASFNDVYAMMPHQLQLGFLKVLKGSPMERCADAYGIVYGSKPPYEVLYTKWLCFDDVLRLKAIEEMIERYYNSCQFTHILPTIIQEFSSPFHMYEALADYYRANGYFISTPSRNYHYQVLLDFACSVAVDKRELFVELLTFDLYLRENLKSRPIFSPEKSIDRETLRHFFEQEKETHQYLNGYDDYTSVQLLRMTHVECFMYPVWKECPISHTDILSTPAFILFDYQNRSALTYDAAFFEISL